MTARLISSKTLSGLHRAQGRTDEICDWLRANDVEPDHVSADHDVTIEERPDGGRVIRYRAFLLDDSGHNLADVARGGEPLTERRTVPLVVEPPDGWPVHAVPGSA
ncbi:hypothetical protein RB200_19595 [Streptomyces sp. PmtG]